MKAALPAYCDINGTQTPIFRKVYLTFSLFSCKRISLQIQWTGNEHKHGKICVRKVDADGDTRESQRLRHNYSCDTHCVKGRRYLVTNKCDYRNDAAGTRRFFRKYYVFVLRECGIILNS